jgi:hypothetical protein
MRTLYKIGFAGWLLGTGLIVLSWVGIVPPMVGWTGFAISLVAAMFTWMPNVQPDQQFLTPQSQEAVPVAPTNLWVQADTPLEPGSRVLAFSQGNWRRARVIALEGNDRVRVNYFGWDPKWEESHRRSQLQLDEDFDPAPPQRPTEPPPAELSTLESRPADTRIERK